MRDRGKNQVERPQSYIQAKDNNKPIGNRKVIVKNLPADITWQKLKDYFKRCGQILHADILHDGKNTFSVSGIVEFANSSSAEEAILILNRSDFGGHRITMSMHKEDGNNIPEAKYLPQATTRVYVGNLAYEATWEDLKAHFLNAGEAIVRADVMMEGNSTRSKGFGIVRYSSEAKALAGIDRMAGTLIMGRPIFLREYREENTANTAPEINHQQQKHQQQHQQQAVVAPTPASTYSQVSPVGRKLWVGNLPYNIQWQDLKDHFRSVGNVLHADILMSSITGKSKGCGIVEFESSAEALRVMAETNGSEIGGRVIVVREDREEYAVSGSTGQSGSGMNGTQHDQSSNSNNTMNGSHNGGGIGCRLFVGNLSYDVHWQELKDHFRKAGHILHADIIQDKLTGRSKGCGVVEYANEADARYARSILDGTDIMGRTVFVREDRDDQTGDSHGNTKIPVSNGNTNKNNSRGGHSGSGSSVGAGGGGSGGRAASGTGKGTQKIHGSQTGQGSSNNSNSNNNNNSKEGNASCRLFVSNLLFEVSWQDLKDHFRQAGDIVRADVFTEAGGRSKGCGTVEFSTPAEAKKALMELSSSMLRGRSVFVREDRDA